MCFVIKIKYGSTNMKPKIIVSSHDLEQIERLIDSLPSTEVAAKTLLLDELSRADIVAPHEVPPSVVTMNSTVRFKMEDSREGFCLTLVYPRDMGDGKDKISILTPVGSALLGLSVGSHITWPRPDGRMMKIQVLDVRQPEYKMTADA
jgi:regulator of nucleoside diphosphate kinase